MSKGLVVNDRPASPDRGGHRASAPPPSHGASAPHLPVSLLVAGHHCLVVGGGRIAARKIASLVEAGAVVTVIAPRLAEPTEALIERALLTVRRRVFEPGDVAEFDLVTTATGHRAVDTQVADAAKRHRIWVNSADDPANCTVMLPAVHRDGPVSIAISTGGASPALASWLRRRIAADYGDRLGALAELLAEGRATVHAQGHTTESIDWQALLDGPLPDLLASGRLDEARALLGRAIGEAR